MSIDSVGVVSSKFDLRDSRDSSSNQITLPSVFEQMTKTSWIVLTSH